MEQLDHGDDLYKKYVAKLTAQEDEFDKVRGEIDALKQEQIKAQSEMEKFIAGLNIQ